VGTSADTSQAAREIQVEAYRAMGGPRRLMAALEISEDVRRIAVAGFRARHPEWSLDKVESAVSALLLADDTAGTE
jgi:hypothetical protein